MDEINWQSIETAPKDGTHVDVWVVRREYGTAETFDGQRMSDVAWGMPTYGPDETWIKRDGATYDAVSDGSQYVVTHWMPLPNPPSKDTP